MKTSLHPLFALALAFGSAPAMAEDDLPKRGADEALDFEPEIQLMDVKPDGNFTPPDVEKAKSAMDRAKNKADRWQQLQKKGVLSKVEAERALIQANRAALRYQTARVSVAKATVDRLKARQAKGDDVRDLLMTAEDSLKTTTQLANEAEELLKKTDAEFAQMNLERQRQLSRAGIGSKTALDRAKAKVKETEKP